MAELWQNLLGSDDRAGIPVTMRQLKKRGRPLLLLPSNRRAAAITLGLYPSQTPLARAAKSLLRFIIRVGFPYHSDRASLSISAENEFIKFLASQAGSPGCIPQFGVLAGNPAHDTQRFIILLFDRNQCPVAIVKAGLNGPARDLIEKEQQFLAKIPPGTKGIPRLCATFADNRVKAFAMDFAEGQSPRPNDDHELVSVLGSW